MHHTCFICWKYRWECLPVFRPNIGKISVAAFWAAIGRAALLLVEAACPPTPGISANHWPSWSHSWLINFTKNVSSESPVSATVYKTLWICLQLVGLGLRCSCVIHVKSPEKQRETDINAAPHFDRLEKKVEEDKDHKNYSVVYLHLINTSDFVLVLSYQAKHSHWSQL